MLIAACSGEPLALDEVYREGYRELERGNVEAAWGLVERGLQRAHSNRDRNWERAFGVLEAEVLVAQRRVAEALDRLDAGLVESGPLDIVRARALMTRGYAACFPESGESAGFRAEADLDEAAKLADSLNSGDIAVGVVLRRGTCAVHKGDLEFAEAQFREALTMAHRQGLRPVEAQAAGSLARIRTLTSQYDDAVRWLRRSLELISNVPAEGTRVKTLGNLGWTYYLLGDHERAVQVLSEAESQFAELGLLGDQVRVLINLGGALYAHGNPDGASRAYERAGLIAEEIGDPARTALTRSEVQMALATLALERGELEEATSRVDDALRIQIEHGLDAARQRTRLLQAQIWARRGALGRAVALIQDVIGSTHTEPDLLWAARASLAQFHVEANRPAEADAEFQRAFELMEMSLSQIVEAEHQLPFFSSLRRFYDDYVGFLVARDNPLDALAVADGSRARLLREHLGGVGDELKSGVDYLQLARELDAFLLFYWTGRERTFLWTIYADGVELITLPGEAALRDLVITYQERILQSRDPIGGCCVEGSELYEVLLGNAASVLPAASRIVVVPDGPLHQLNFETLVVSEPEPHYLIEDMNLVRAPSLRSLAAVTEPERAEAPSLLAIGDPISPSDEFPQLPFAGREIASLAELFPPGKRQVYSDVRAERSAYRGSNPGQFTYIHFAAHAQANPVVPLDSAVVLSARGDDYKLYAREIVNIPLDAELVTLSACRSAGGRTFAGEGLVGLSWAFLSAGARHVIGGLWQVEDASTAELMEHLYRELVAGAEPAVALRRAKLELLRSDTAYRKPYYWAPFVTYTSRAGSQSQMRSTASNRSAHESSSSASSGSSPSASEATAASARAPSKST